MTLDIGEHVNQGTVQGELPVTLRPPWHLADGVERKRVDGDVGMSPRSVTELNDAAGRFTGPHPHVAVRLAILPPGQCLWEGTPEHKSEVARFATRDVSEESEQVRAGRDQRSAHVVLRQP